VKLAVAYIRVSTAEQELGPEAQAESIRVWAAEHDVEICGEFRDVCSGTIEVHLRKGFTGALAAIATMDADFLVVAKRDRLGRMVVHCAVAEQLVRSMGARVVSADDPGGLKEGPEVDLIRTILDANAQFERARLAVRVKEALAIKRGRGELIGQLSYGYMRHPDPKNKVLLPHPTEHEAVKKILAWHKKGLGLRAICRKCEEERILSRTGLVFEPQQIKRIISRELSKNERQDL